MKGFTSLKGVDVDKMFKGKLKVYDGRGKRKGKKSKSKKGVGVVRDVELKAYAGAWDYYVPKAALDALEVWGEVSKEGINLTWLAKSGNSQLEGGQGEVQDVVLDVKFYRALKEFVDELRRGWDNNKLFRCGVLIKGTCRNEACGRVHIIKNPCKREWCPDCGVPGSAYHMYLFAKALNYAMEMWRQSGAVGYFVITCPLELREKWKDKEVLSEVVRYIRRMLAREGFPYGYYKWHFAGDENPGVWYPHLNVLVPGGYLTSEKLERIKKLIEKHLGVKVVHYEYAKDPAQIIHMVYYITRPTWNMQVEVSSDGWSKFRKNGIWGKKYFRNASVWREWLKELNNVRKEAEGNGLNVVLMDLKGEKEEITEEDLEEMLGPTEDGPEIVEFSSPEEELLNASFEVWWVKEALKGGICSKCGGELKWEGVIKDLDNEYIKGQVFRIGWNVWVIDERRYPKEENEENEEVRSP
jgi:hypothetical protein